MKASIPLSFSRRRVQCAVALMAAAVLTACGASPSATQTSSARRTVQNLSPAAKGPLNSITWDLPQGEPTSLDVTKAGSYSSDEVVADLCDNLLRLNPNYTVSPNIATSWRQPNSTTMVYQIRRGVHFWDGSELTSADVVYSLERQEMPSVEGVYGINFKYVKSIMASGPYEVTVKFTRPDSLFNKEMAVLVGGIVEAKYAKAKGLRYGTPSGGLMCTGPYELKSWSPGNSIVLTANPHYWNTADKPKVAKITFKFITDTTTLTHALLTGEIDGTYDLPATAIPALRSAATGKIYYGPSLLSDVVDVLQPTGPLANVDVRRALSMAINRQAIASLVYQGAAVPAKTIIPPATWNTDPAAAIYRRAYAALPGDSTPDLKAAKALLAHVAKPIPSMTLGVLTGDQPNLEAASLIQAAARSIGLTIQIKTLGSSQFANAYYEPSARAGLNLLGGGFPIYLDTPDYLDYVNWVMLPKALFNYLNYHNPTVISLLEKDQQTFNPTQKAQYLTEAQSIYTRDVVEIPLVYPYEVSFMNNAVTGAPTSGSYLMSPWAAMLGARK